MTLALIWSRELGFPLGFATVKRRRNSFKNPMGERSPLGFKMENRHWGNRGQGIKKNPKGVGEFEELSNLGNFQI